MHEVKIYIEPQDILDKLSEEDRKRFNRCILSDVEKDMNGVLTISYVLFNDTDIEEKRKYTYRYKLCSEGEIKL